MRLELENGIYEGEGYGNTRHGYGVMRYTCGNRYEGQFVNDRMNGRGKYYYAKGGYYEGEMLDGMFEGEGEQYSEDGFYYIGSHKQDKIHGKGKLVYPNGDWYEGEFCENQKHGPGRAFFDGYLFVGVWRKNDFFKGNVTCPDGTIFDGDWCGSYGTNITATFAGGVVKRGRVIRRKFIPIGVSTHKTMTYSNGTYVGDIVEGKRHGKGKYTFNNGVVYDGDWYEGFRDGDGVMTTSLYTYKGGFLYDHRSDFGEVTFKNGTRLYGTWIDDANAYNAVQIDKRGNELCGIVIDGKFIPNTTPGYVMKWYSNGYYHGIMKNGTRMGEGIYLWKNGTAFAGLWCRERFGKGVFRYVDGAMLQGTWVGSQLAYDVTRTSKDGEKQTGLYIQDNFIPVTTPGFETVNLSGGTGKYVGIRKNGRLTGYGCVKYSSGDIAIGTFEDGYLVGKGATVYAEDFHIGMFAKGVPEGKGVSYLLNGDSYEGDWRGYDYADNVKFNNSGKTTTGTIRGGYYCGK